MTVDDFAKWNQEAEATTVTKHEVQWSYWFFPEETNAFELGSCQVRIDGIILQQKPSLEFCPPNLFTGQDLKQWFF